MTTRTPYHQEEEEEQQQPCHVVRRSPRRTKLQRLVAAAIVLELSTQSVSSGFQVQQQQQQHRPSFLIGTNGRTSLAVAPFSSSLSSSSLASSKQQEGDGSVLTLNDENERTFVTKRDVGMPLSVSYQRQARSMMEATTMSQETERSMGEDDISSKSSSSLAETIVSPEEYQRGILTIGFCTLVFASMSPAMHACLAPSTAESGGMMMAPPVLLLNAAVSAVAFMGLVLAGPWLEKIIPKPSTLIQQEQAQEPSSQQSPRSSKDTITELSSQTMSSASETTATDHQTNPLTSITNRAGLELGLWKFLGTTANLFGLSLTSADHGAFLIQLTTLIVPTVQGIMGVPIGKRIQCSIALALAGVALFTQDFSGVSSSEVAAATTTAVATDMEAVTTAATTAMSPQQQLTGDALCVVAAAFYATYDLRLFEWGKRVAPRELITTKIGAQALFSGLLLLGAPGAWSETMTFVQAATTNSNFDGTLLLALVLWSGFMVNAIVPFLQVGGQQAIGPTRAQTLYASQPLWAAVMSYFFLGETVCLQGLVGGGAFLVALFLAATAEAPGSTTSSEDSSSTETAVRTTATTIAS